MKSREYASGEPAPGPDVKPSLTLLEGRQRVAEIIAHWRAGQPADVQQALAQHPELAADKTLVLDLILEEWTLRAEAGETPDPMALCQQFPELAGSIRKLFAADWFFDTHPELFDPLVEEPPPPPIPWPVEGETFLEFRLTRLLGSGQFARVFLACQEAMGNRLVVVKVAPQGAGEAKTLGRLSHPNIVPVHSVHQDGATGLTAVCMPYLGSATLDDVMARLFAGSDLPLAGQVLRQAVRDATSAAVPAVGQDPALPRRPGTYVEEVIYLGRQLAEALAHAHEHGVYHGDLKPSNVLLTPKGWPMLLDFNLSFDLRQHAQFVGGTVPYMSPEQLRAFIASHTAGPLVVDRHAEPPLDGRSDLFSLGVLLYELLTKTHPFMGGQRAVLRPRGNSPGPLATLSMGRSPRAKEQARKEAVVRLCRRQLERQQVGLRSVRQANPQLDPYLASVLERCLALEPAARFQSAAELVAALDKYLFGLRRLRRWVARHCRALLAASFLVVGIAAASAYAWSLRPPYSMRQLSSGWDAYHRGDYAQALAHFDQATQADPALGEAFFARGRAYQQLGDFQRALVEYKQADQLVSDGRFMACRGYCYAALNLYQDAVAHFSRAIEAGFATAEVFNNLGYCALKRNDLQVAQQQLQQALDGNPRLQAAYHNRLKLHLRRGLRLSEKIPAPWLEDLRQALALGPGTADLYFDAAQFYALAARTDRQWIEPALDCLNQCIELRQTPQPTEKDPLFFALRQEARFQDLMRRLPSPPLSSRILPLLDPLTGDSLMVRP